MEWIVWAGAALALLGLLGIVWVAFGVARLRKTAADDAAMRAHLAKAVPQNLAAFFIAVIGLMMVVVGVILG